MGPTALAQVLTPLKQYDLPGLLVGLKTGDDAAVYQISSEQAVILTVDFFPPVVDDAYAFGAIAAANAVSDVYAMGGEVLIALNIAAFPDDLPVETLQRVLQGGADKVAEAGGVIAGGHTIVDREPKYGLSVMGMVHPRQVRTKAGALPGDRILLSKAVGTGVVTTAMKADLAELSHAESAVESMLALNRQASRLMQRIGAHACTDVTGFGLMGHAGEVSAASGTGLVIHAAAVPLLPGALKYAADSILPGGTWRNRDHMLGKAGMPPTASVASDVPDELANLLFSPETSGGLLIFLPPPDAASLRALCIAEGQEVWEIGEVVAGAGVTLVG